MADIY